MKRWMFLEIIIITSLVFAGCGQQPYPVVEDESLGLSSEAVMGAAEDQLTRPQEFQPNAPQQANQQRQPNQQVQGAQMPVTPKPTQVRDVAYPQKPDIPAVTTMRIQTEKGEIVVKLYPEEAPQTITNYVTKAADKFWDGLTFHRVEDWVVQGGDPDGNGTGGGTVPTETSTRPFVKGSAGVARGSNIDFSNDAQFFFCTKDCTWLNNKYTMFGTVIEGMEVVESITQGDVIQSVSIE